MNNKHYVGLLLAILLHFPSLEIAAQTIKRGPYPQLSTQNSIIIRWRTDVTTSAKVWYGTNANNLSQTATVGGTTKDHSVQITGLSPGTKYYYRIGNNAGQYPAVTNNQYFKTHPAGNSNNQVIRAWMLGNAGTGDPEQETVRDAYYAVTGDEHIDMILFTGDNAYDDGRDSEYQELIFDMYQERLANTVSWSCFGNHDAGDAESSDESGTYYEVFDFPRNGEAGGLPTGTEAYFSFDYGNMHVISLNTVDVDREPDGDMVQWLEADLAATEGKWKVVLLHHRPYTGSNGNDSDDDTKPTDVREYFLPVMEAAGVDLVLSSHSHSYQRSFLINGHYGKSNTFSESTHGVDMGDGQIDGDGAYSKIDSDIGTVYVVAGTAGQDRNGAEDLNHPVMHYNSGSAGSVQLLVSDSELLFQFINEDEEVEDYFTIQKPASGQNDGFTISNPLDGAVFPPQQNITITTELSEENMALVAEVRFHANGNMIGSDNSFPYYQAWNVPAMGEYQLEAIAYDDAGTMLFQSNVSISAGTKEICIPIATGSDDAEQRSSGSLSLTSGDLELVQDSDVQQIGLRFTNVGIAPNTTISEAYLQFTTDETQNINPSQLIIHGEKTPNPATFVKVNDNISSRNKTNAFVTWSPPSWQSIGASGSGQRSPNIASVVQEAVNQSAYAYNNALAFIITGSGKRVADSYEGGADKAAKLCITYTPEPCSDIDSDGICDDNDPCPSGPEFGLACNDGNASTYNDAVDENCNCVGIPGNCPSLGLPIGASCNDNNATTYNDIVNQDCNCQGTLFDCTLLLANVGSPCNDGNPNTSNDMIDGNCNCVGSLFDCPSLELNVGDSCNDGNPATINDVVTTACNCVGTLLQEETVFISVSNSSDDAEQRENGSLSLSSSDLELTQDGTNQLIGLRFLATGIPAGANITEAYIQFTVDETKTLDPCLISISGETSLNAATFANVDGNISSRPRTAADAVWQPETWTSIGLEGEAQRTSNISAIVQEMVNRAGYNDSKPMAFIFEGQGRRVAESYDGKPSKAPKLVVSYVFFCEDDDGDGTCNPQDVCNGAEPGSPCNDNNVATYDDVITSNCNCSGTAFDCSVFLANVGDTCNDGNPLTINDVIDGNCNCVGIPFGVSQTVCTRVLSSNDDAEEELDGSVSTTSSDLELVDDDGSQLIGMRFSDLGIPQGAIIESAKIQFEVDETENIDPCLLTFFAEATDNASPFEKSDFNLSNRPTTTAEVNWSPSQWNEKGDSGPSELTVNIASVLQEVVSRSGFTANSAVVFLVDGYGKRVAESYDGGAAKAPELCVTYSLSGPPSAGMTSLSNGNGFEAENSRNAQLELKEREEFSDLTVKSIQSLTLYPNPTKGIINLSFYSEVEREYEVKVESVNGLLQKTGFITAVKGNNAIQMSDLNLGNGVYVLRIWMGGAWGSRKFVVVR